MEPAYRCTERFVSTDDVSHYIEKWRKYSEKDEYYEIEGVQYSKKEYYSSILEYLWKLSKIKKNS